MDQRASAGHPRPPQDNGNQGQQRGHDHRRLDPARADSSLPNSPGRSVAAPDQRVSNAAAWRSPAPGGGRVPAHRTIPMWYTKRRRLIRCSGGFGGSDGPRGVRHFTSPTVPGWAGNRRISPKLPRRRPTQRACVKRVAARGRFSSARRHCGVERRKQLLGRMGRCQVRWRRGRASLAPSDGGNTGTASPLLESSCPSPNRRSSSPGRSRTLTRSHTGRAGAGRDAQVCEIRSRYSWSREAVA